MSAGTLRSSEEPVTHPVGYRLPSFQGGSGDELVFSSGESYAADLGARVLDGRPAGSRCHGQELYGPQKDLDKTYFAGHNKYMTNTEAFAAELAINTGCTIEQAEALTASAIRHLLIPAVERFGSVDKAAEALTALMSA